MSDTNIRIFGYLGRWVASALGDLPDPMRRPAMTSCVLARLHVRPLLTNLHTKQLGARHPRCLHGASSILRNCWDRHSRIPGKPHNIRRSAT